jgi:ribosomal protein S18 acetylase RimI-like enzyme
LRSSGGPTHRGNSVAPLDAKGALPVDERIAHAEAFYRARGQVPLFQVGPCAAPKDLDQVLADRGYVIEGAAVNALTTPEEVLARLPRTLETSVTAKPSDAWLEIGARASRFADSYDVLLGFLSRLGSRCRFALARDANGHAVATCFGITSEDRLGIYAMFTLPDARRKGAATALLRALAESAVVDRMRGLHLLVEEDNTTARSLYARAGFVDAYRYHYRKHR